MRCFDSGQLLGIPSLSLPRFDEVILGSGRRVISPGEYVVRYSSCWLSVEIATSD